MNPNAFQPQKHTTTPSVSPTPSTTSFSSMSSPSSSFAASPVPPSSPTVSQTPLPTPSFMPSTTYASRYAVPDETSALDGTLNPAITDASTDTFANAYTRASSSTQSLSSHLLKPTKANIWAAVATILTLGLIASIMLSISLTRQNQTAKNLAATPQYPNTTIPLASIDTSQSLALGQLAQIDLNGRVVVNGSLVLSPKDTPTNAVNGELYYDQTTGTVAYYNGNEFKALVTSNQTVANIGGLQGSIALGDGLTTSNGRLSLTNPTQPVNPATANTPIPTSYVSSLQGQVGALTLMPGTGIAITTSTTGSGLTATTSVNLTNTGITSIANLTGALLTGRGIITTGNVISSNITLTSGSADLAVTDDGNGNYTVSSTGVGAGGTVALGPSSPQADNTTNPSISINKTNISSPSNLIDLKVTNASKFTVDSTGTITTGSIAYTQVTGRPTTTVESLGGASGTIALGSGLSLIGNILSSTTSGITAINSTTDQITANTVAGVTTLSLPQSIATSSSPTFANLNLTNALSVANGGTGATTAAAARTNLSAAASGSNNDITSLTNLTNITPIASLTIGSTQSLTLQGTTTTLTSTNGANTSTLSFATPTTNNSIIIPNQSGTICLSTGNCLGGASGGATTSLNNLSSVAINTSLLPGTTTIDLGSSINPFRDAYIGSTATNNFRLTGTASAPRTITFPDATGTVCLTTGNCAGSGGGITGTGTQNTIAMFTGSGTIGNSMLTQNAGATTLTISGDLSVNSGTGSITGNGANLTALNASNISTGTLAIARGGTNLNTTPTNGQLLIGNGTGYTLAALTEGSNITITNTPGGISIGANMPAAGANTSLSNLASVAINTSLLPGTSGINLGSATQPFGSIYLGTGSNNVVLSATTTAGRTITLPDADGTICLQASTACGYAASSGSSNYIQNQYASQQPTSSLWISGIARSDTSVLTPTLDTATATALGIGTTNATAINLGRAATTTTIAGTLLATGNNITLGTVGSSQITNNGSTLNITLALGDYPTGGNIGTAADTVNIYTSFTVNQTTANQTLTIPSPTNTVAGRVIYISNIGSATFNISGVPINASSSATFVWSGSTWNIVGSSTGVTAVGILDSQTKSVNGASIVGNTIYFQSADATNPGMVNTSNQTFAGAKTFTSLLTASAGANISGAAVNLNASSNFATNINTGTSTGLVTIGGSSLIAKNTANTTAAFQVQNAAGTSVLNVDTTNAIVNVGTAATYIGYAAGASFAGKVDYTTGTGPQGVSSADVNGDTKMDIIIANYTANTVSILINNGNGTFAAKVDYITGARPQSVTNADVNGDSKPDILVANYNSSTASVFINNGNGTFAAKVDYTTGTNPYSIAAADVNNDTYPDMLVANYNSSTASVFINNGNGTFATKVDYTTGTNPISITTTDVNGDTKPDMLVTNNSSNTASVFINNGNGTFAAKVDYTTGSSPYSITTTDVNGDTKPDMLVANNSSNTVSVIMNSATVLAVKSNFSTTIANVNQAGYILQAAAGQTADLFRVQDSTGTNTLFNIGAAGNVGIGNTANTYKLDVNGTTNVRGDLYVGGIKRIDSLGNLYNINNYTPVGNVLFQNQLDSNTSFQVQTATAANMLSIDTTNKKITVGTAGTSQFINNGSTLNTALALANFASGGAIGTAAATVDVYTTFNITQTTSGQTLTIPGPTTTTAGRIIYIINKGTASFTIGTYTIGAGTTATYIWNGTAWIASQAGAPGVTQVGALDSQAKNANGAVISGSNIYLQTADATNPGLVSTTDQTFAGAKTFTSLLTASAGANILGAAVNINASSNFATNINTGTSTGVVTIGGSSLTAKNTANSTSAFKVQNAAGTSILNVDTSNATVNVGTAATYLSYTAGAGFASKVDYATGTNPYGITSADVNSDGKLDVITTNNGTNTVSVFINNGNGTFAAKVDYIAASSGPRGVTAADVNGDSKPDLLVINWYSSAVAVLINNGNGTFAAKVDYSIGWTSYEIAVVDVNGDTHPDIISSAYGSNTFSVNINNGNGTFAAKVDYTTGTGPYGISSADFNGDGNPDVVVANSGSNTVSVYINNGNGTFAAKVDYTTGTLPQGLTAADVNGDTHPDILVANYTSNNVSVLTNNGSGTFATKVDYTTGTAPIGVTTADVNGDSKPDMLVANYTSNNVSILTNNGSGTFATKVDYTTGARPYSITTADVNGDSKSDIITANNSANTVSVIMNSSTVIGVKSNFSTTIANVNQAGYILQAAAGQTADLFRVQDSTGTNTLFNIGAAGNVGIGNTATTYKLDVNGTTNVRGDLYVGGIKRIDSLGNLYNINNYTPVGNVLFQNQLNSTTSFRVQDAVANNMLAIDTTNKKITIGTAGTSQFINNGSTLNTALALANFASGGAIGTAAATVDVYTTFNITQTTTGQTLTIPSPTTTTAGRIIYIINKGTASFTIGTYTIGAGTTATYIWNGTTWIASQAGAPGVTTVGTLDSQTKSANGAVISGSNIYLQTADATNPGLVSTSDQTFAGAKTFTSLLTGTAGANILGAAVNINVSSNFNTNINTGTSTGTVTIGGNSVLFKNTNNSTAAMVIQNSTGTPLFTADTTNMKVTITNLVVTGNLTVNGHIITTGTNPTIAAGAAACTAPTVSVTGNDTTGIISITTGTGCAATGVMGTVTFASAFASAPRISITPTNTNAANIKYFSGASAINNFTLDTGTVLTNTTVYTFSYIVTQ